ncbi:hypothetical protein LPTSP4_23020 [Leptospira ryugenii]|uniref:Uncharacterized protein n=1 Tax=Leptospira ryugenii TaxID=1917863 RepID=A0A2P2E1L2_9LEPT|nr:hypothetical protein [Leptospira ryugenii]GBF50775.1 hypothetical protein LPTSP4_23020 [Leptospira ryugenii]
MVDFKKKINLPKVNVDPKKVLGAADGLVGKIPPQVAALLRKIAIALLIFFLLMAIYTGWTRGWENATPQGLQLASDTRSLFAMELEKEYNRSRKDVRMTDPEEIEYEHNKKMQFEFISERESINPTKTPIPEEDDFLGKERDFRNRKNESTTPPLASPSGEGLISSPIDVESVGSWQNTDTLQEINDTKVLDRKDTQSLPQGKPKKVEQPILDPIDKQSIKDDERYDKIMDRITKLEKLKKEKSKETLPSSTQEPEKKKVRELERVPR